MLAAVRAIAISANALHRPCCSAMTCHSQASVDQDGNSGIGGVGATWRPNLFGFNQVVMGAPDDDWFFDPGTTTYDAVQTDFIWGILAAQCIAPGSGGTCACYPTSPGEQCQASAGTSGQ
ncbi:MAG: hypothetical protein GY835_18415 [bacterium]|nr:hypothetical protein [bacterium]